MKKIGRGIIKRPLLSFVGALLVLFLIIFVSDRLRMQTDDVVEQEVPVKMVETVRADNGQYAELSGRVEKDGVVTVIAHVSGIVHGLYVEDGQEVRKGQRIAYLSDTYGGGSSAAVGHQIAARQSQSQDETFEKRMSTIDDQRDDVPKKDDLESAIARKQFTLEKRSAELDFDLTKLQEKQAAVSAARYAPVSPFTGVVDHVFVSRGETVNVGDRIAVVNADDQVISVSVNISPSLAGVVDVARPSKIFADGQEIEVLPRSLSRDVADDQSYVMTYVIAQEHADLFVHNEFVAINIPIEVQSDSARGVLVPLDAVRLMSEGSVIFVMENGVAHPKSVTTGEVVGGFIFVDGDIAPEDEIILNRNVFDGDHVTVSA